MESTGITMYDVLEAIRAKGHLSMDDLHKHYPNPIGGKNHKLVELVTKILTSDFIRTGAYGKYEITEKSC